jgi:hypothetical protein
MLFSMRHLAAFLLAASLMTTSGCAHWQPTRKQVAIGIIGATVATLLIILVVTQCNKGAASCDDTNTQ